MVLIAHGDPQRIVQIGAVHVVERRAPTSLPGVGERDPAQDRVALPVAKVPRLRADTDRMERLCKPQPVQDSDRVGAKCKSRADLAQDTRLLIHLTSKPD
jgi:hypothetical protein